jgi:hypothetical protein
MTIIDPGHIFELEQLDTPIFPQRLTFVKRMGDKYPSNTSCYPGTNMQEVLRALIHRTLYLNRQDYCMENVRILQYERACIRLLEERAARRHGRELLDLGDFPEIYETCHKCLHIGCEGGCH